MDKIASFSGKYRFLSNFYPSPLEWEGVTYPSVEHAFQALKTDDPDWRRRIKTADTPGAAKRLGRQCPKRVTWDKERVKVMGILVHCKFRQNPDLEKKLLATGDAELEEGNTWGDKFWGVDLKSGVGENKLGKLLMLLRIVIQEANKA